MPRVSQTTVIHFVNEDAERPVVHWLSMSLVQQDLGRDVFGGAAEGVRAVDDHLGEAEVREL